MLLSFCLCFANFSMTLIMKVLLIKSLYQVFLVINYFTLRQIIPLHIPLTSNNVPLMSNNAPLTSHKYQRQISATLRTKITTVECLKVFCFFFIKIFQRYKDEYFKQRNVSKFNVKAKPMGLGIKDVTLLHLKLPLNQFKHIKQS